MSAYIQPDGQFEVIDAMVPEIARRTQFCEAGTLPIFQRYLEPAFPMPSASWYWKHLMELSGGSRVTLVPALPVVLGTPVVKLRDPAL